MNPADEKNYECALSSGLDNHVDGHNHDHLPKPDDRPAQKCIVAGSAR